nr:hypothetical protein [Candidatus Sigynarchaeota archaeon]
THAVRVTCPTCKKTHVVDIPATAVDGATDTGLLAVSFKAQCGHTCIVFIDKNFRMRGGQCADLDLGEIDAKQSTGIELETILQEVYHISDLVVKFATEVIKMNALDARLIESINVVDKIKDVEIALIRGDIVVASDRLVRLGEFASEIGESDLAERLLQNMQKINNLIVTKAGFDWTSIILKKMEAHDEVEFARAKAIHYERVRKILAELEYEAIVGTIDRKRADAKKAQLMLIVDEL